MSFNGLPMHNCECGRVELASLRIATQIYALAEKTIITNYTDKKGNTIILIYKEM
jgi:hypothetical protein